MNIILEIIQLRKYRPRLTSQKKGRFSNSPLKNCLSPSFTKLNQERYNIFMTHMNMCNISLFMDEP